MATVKIPDARFNVDTETRASILENLPQAWMKVNNVPATVAPTDGRPRRRRAGVYMRFSTDNQDVYTFARQKRGVTEYAERIDVDIIEIFADPASSGAFTANRPAYKSMFKAARQKKFDLIIVEDGDRLARRLHITTKAFSDLADLGIEMHSTRLGQWSLMHAAFVGMMSEEQRRRIFEVMRSGIVKILNQAKWPVSAPAGYEKIPGEPGNMRIVELHADSIRKGFDLRASGLGYYQIAEIAAREQWPISFKNWTGSTVKSMLHNPIYAGIIAYFRSSYEKTQTDDDTIEIKRVPREMKDWIFAVREDWRIVTPETWRAVRARDADSTNTGPRSIYLLSQKMYCGECGKRMHIGGGRNQIPKLRCSTEHAIRINRQKLQPCNASTTSLGPLEDQIINLVCAKLDHPQALAVMQRAHESTIATESKADDLKRSRLKKAKEALHARLDATYDKALSAGMSTTALVTQRQGYCARIDTIDEELASIPAVTICKNPIFSTPIDSSAFLDELVPGRNYRDCGEALARTIAIFQQLVGKIVVRTDSASGRVDAEVTGPIASIGNDKPSISISYQPPSTCNNKIRSTRVKASHGEYDVPDEVWAKIGDRLPQDPIWIPAFDEPVNVRRVIEAMIASKKSGIAVVNLSDTFGPPRQVWAAARILNYGGILDIAQNLLVKNCPSLIADLSLAIDSVRSPQIRSEKQAIERHVAWNERRRQQVVRRLANGNEAGSTAA